MQMVIALCTQTHSKILHVFSFLAAAETEKHGKASEGPRQAPDFNSGQAQGVLSIWSPAVICYTDYGDEDHGKLTCVC